MNAPVSDFIIKICGLTRVEDALLAARLGANALGFVFVPGVSRTVDPGEARGMIALLRQVLGPACPQIVGLFSRQPPEEVKRVAEECAVDAVQIHGSPEAPYFRQLRSLMPHCSLWKAVAIDHHSPLRLRRDMAEEEVDAYVLDVPKGSPTRMFDWGLMAVAQQPHCCRGRPVLLAGGLTAANVGSAVARTHPGGVDVSSGIEARVRRKEPQEVAQFIYNAQQSARSRDRESMARRSLLARLLEAGLLTSLPPLDGEDLLSVAGALKEGGMMAWMVPYPGSNALENLAACRHHFGGEALVGVDLVRRAVEAQRAIAAGAEFVAGPHFSPAVQEVCSAQGIPYLPQAATPTETVTAWEAGGDLVRIFTLAARGGGEYIRALKTSYPEVSLGSAGGVHAGNVSGLVQAGSLVLEVGAEQMGMGGERELKEIARRGRELVEAVEEARGEG